MDNGFFSDHPFLGSMFDFDHDGSLDPAEAAFMGGMAAAYIDEAERSARESERRSSFWDDDDDDDEEEDEYEYDIFGDRVRKERRSDDSWDDGFASYDSW